MEGVALEELSYRNWAKKTAEAEERSIMLESLVKNGVGFPEVEMFAKNEESKRRGGNNKLQIRSMVRRVMKEKTKDNYNFALKSRQKRDNTRMRLERMLGKDSRVYREIVRNVKRNCDKLRRNCKKRFAKKAEFLTRKYGTKRMSGM